MRVTTQQDGSLLVEDRGDQFSALWATAKQHEKVVLPDGRPGVRRHTAMGVMYTTVHAHAWDILRRLPRNRPVVYSKGRLCQWCGSELKVSREYEGCWCFTCPKCKSAEVHDKRLVGGTVGGGQKEKR